MLISVLFFEKLRIGRSPEFWEQGTALRPASVSLGNHMGQMSQGEETTKSVGTSSGLMTIFPSVELLPPRNLAKSKNLQGNITKPNVLGPQIQTLTFSGTCDIEGSTSKKSTRYFLVFLTLFSLFVLKKG